MHQNCPLVTRITFSYRFWCCDSRTAQICPMSHSSFPWSYSQKQSRLWSMFYAISGSRTSTLSSAAPTSAFPLASWHPHILPGWHLCIASVCSSLWPHRAAKRFCAMVLLCGVLRMCQETATKNQFHSGWKRLKISYSQISASSTLKCFNMCKRHWLSQLGYHGNGSRYELKFSSLV